MPADKGRLQGIASNPPVTIMRKTAPLILMLAGFMLLAGCSKEPSEADMRQAVEAGTRRNLAGRSGSGFQGFDAFRKQGCVAARDKSEAYDCYYNATFAPAPGQKVTVNGKGRFRQSDKGLIFEDLGAVPDGRAAR